MRIYRFQQFNESVYDSPESQIMLILKKIKSKVEKMFADNSETSIMTMDEMDEKSKKSEEAMTLTDMGVKLISSEISSYSKSYDSYKVKFSDEENIYDLIITIPLEDVITKDKAAQAAQDDDGTASQNKDETDSEGAGEENFEESFKIAKYGKIINEESNIDLSEEVTECEIKFKKYKAENIEYVGEISKKANIDDINEDFLISLKLELDKSYEDADQDDFKLEM